MTVVEKPAKSLAQRKREERDAEIVRLAKLNVPTSRIAGLVRCSVQTVQKVRRAHGVAQPASVTKALSAKQIEQARGLLADGASQREVARTLDVAHKTVSKYFPGTGWSHADRIENERVLGVDVKPKMSPRSERRRNR